MEDHNIVTKIQSSSVYINGTLYSYDGISSATSKFLWLYDLTKSNSISQIPYTQMVSSTFPDNSQVILFDYYPTQSQSQLILYTPNAKNENTSFLYVRDFSNFVPHPILNSDSLHSKLGIGILGTKNGDIWSLGGINVNKKDRTAYCGFFHFDSKSNKWEDLSQSTIESDIPNLAYHTFTNINDDYLVALGGGTPSGKGQLYNQNFNKLYQFDIKNRAWSTHNLTNCPSDPRFGHSATLVKDQLIIIGGKKKIFNYDPNDLYDDMYSIDLKEYTCSKIVPNTQSNQPTTIKRAWHANTLVDNQLILSLGLTNSSSDPRMIILDTNNWTMQENFIQSDPQAIYKGLPASPEQSSVTNIVLYSLLGVFLLVIVIFLLYYFIRRRRNKTLRSDYFGNQSNSNPPSLNNVNPEWTNEDKFSFKLNYSTIFTLTQSVGSKKSIFQDTKDDLDHLNEPHIPYRRWSSDEVSARSKMALIGVNRFQSDEGNESTLIPQSDNQVKHHFSNHT